MARIAKDLDLITQELSSDRKLAEKQIRELVKRYVMIDPESIKFVVRRDTPWHVERRLTIIDLRCKDYEDDNDEGILMSMRNSNKIIIVWFKKKHLERGERAISATRIAPMTYQTLADINNELSKILQIFNRQEAPAKTVSVACT